MYWTKATDDVSGLTGLRDQQAMTVASLMIWFDLLVREAYSRRCVGQQANRDQRDNGGSGDRATVGDSRLRS